MPHSRSVFPDLDSSDGRSAVKENSGQSTSDACTASALQQASSPHPQPIIRIIQTVHDIIVMVKVLLLVVGKERLISWSALTSKKEHILLAGKTRVWCKWSVGPFSTYNETT